MAKVKLDLHEIYNKGGLIQQRLKEALNEARQKKIRLIEIIPGKGSGQLKKTVLRFLQSSEVNKLYSRIEKDDKNFGRIFVHLRYDK